MNKNTIKKKKIRKDCWNLDYAFLQWLRERLPVYLRDAGTIVDLSYYKVEYKGKEYTQEELTRLLYSKVEYLCKIDFFLVKEEENIDIYKEVFEIWAIIAPYTWW